MARELDEVDLQILKKLVPELEGILNAGITVEYMNVLPPVANHHSRDEVDFLERLKRLTSSEIQYLADQVLSGNESLGCMYPEFAEAFFTIAEERLSKEVSDQLREAYLS